MSLARLVGGLEELRVPEGQAIVREGAAADGLYLLEEGEVSVHIASSDGDVEVATVVAPAHFGDLGLLLARRTATVSARTEAVVRRLPRERFEQLVRERPEIGLAVATSLAERFEQRQRQLIGAPEQDVETRPLTVERGSGRSGGRYTWLGAALALLVPLALWAAAPPAGLEVRGWHVLLVLLGAAVAWLVEPVPDFVVAIGLAAAWGLTSGVPLSAAFGGFATSTWVLSVGALALAGAMARSGLLFRIGLYLLRLFPPTLTGQVLALVTSGIALTPLVPQSVARVAAIAPVTAELRTTFGLAPRSNGAAALAFAGLVGHWSFANMFLTGFATNFFVLELVPAAERASFGWAGWLGAAAVALAVSIAGGIAALLLLFPERGTPALSRDTLAGQVRVMAGLSTAERLTATSVLVLIAGLLLQPFLGIEPAWIALATLVIVVPGVLGRDGFRTAVDWPYLLFFGILLGSATVLQQAGIATWLGAQLGPVASAVGQPALVVLALALFIVVLRFVLPSRPAMLLMSLVAMPAAPALGFSPWVAGFVVLLCANTWVLPYQGLEYLLLRGATRGESFSDAQGTRMGIALIAVRLVAIVASVPYWMALGLIR